MGTLYYDIHTKGWVQNRNSFGSLLRDCSAATDWNAVMHRRIQNRRDKSSFVEPTLAGWRCFSVYLRNRHCWTGSDTRCFRQYDGQTLTASIAAYLPKDVVARSTSTFTEQPKLHTTWSSQFSGSRLSTSTWQTNFQEFRIE